MDSKREAFDIYRAGVAAVQPGHLMQQNITRNKDGISILGKKLEKDSFEKIFVIGAGKAAASMAVETEKILGEDLHQGIVVTKYGHALPTKKIKILEAGHPVPDQGGIRAVEETLALLGHVSPNDIIICLISGGASALWCDLPKEISLPAFQQISSSLVNSGADIREINGVRKHISSIKGGQLIPYCRGARFFGLLISDVPGDDQAIIGSGPSTADPSTFHEAMATLRKYALYDSSDDQIRTHIKQGCEGSVPETPKPGDPVFNYTTNRVIGNNKMALEAAATCARAKGFKTILRQSTVTGDTSAAAIELVRSAVQYQGTEPYCIIQGGETTLQVNGTGLGGRNQHFALVALKELLKAGHTLRNRSITVLSAGTDGTDGPTPAAGAFFNEEIIQKVISKNISVDEYLNRFDSYHFFEKAGGLLITGPTQTNVMDISIMIINPVSP